MTGSNTPESEPNGSVMESPPSSTEAVEIMDPSTLEESSSFTLEEAMESVVRITLAGLGGSMLGLSQGRKLESMRVVTGAAATAAARRKRAPSAQLANLPLTWALSCMAFCAMIEGSRRMAPSSQIISLLLDDHPPDNGTNSPDETKSHGSKVDPRIQSFLGTVADYTFGGAVGGFAASMGRNTHLRKQLPSSMLRGSQRLFGVVPGIALGFVAGIIQASTDAGIAYLEQLQREQSTS
jgi:hypothetical protein